MWQCGYNVAKVDQKDQGYKDGIFQVETCRIREVYKTKPMANLTCFNVSSRTACGTLKIHMLPSTASINTCQTCCCQHIFKQVHATTCEVKSSFLMTSGEEKHLLCKEMNVIFMLLQAYLECTFFHMWHPCFQFLAHLNCTFHLKVSRWLSPTSSCDLGLSRSPGRIRTCTSRVDEISIRWRWYCLR